MRMNGIDVGNDGPDQSYEIMIPLEKITRQLEEYRGRKEYDKALQLLRCWLAEAKETDDKWGQLSLRNDLISLYRRMGNMGRTMHNTKRALELVVRLGAEEDLAGGVTYVNAATAYARFGKNETALAIFRKAEKIYSEAEGVPRDCLGGLYNNMAAAFAALSMQEEALCYYKKALEIMKDVPGGEMDEAITYLNIADMVARAVGMEKGKNEIKALLGKAYRRLCGSRAGYEFAAVCEKCAPVFSHYGYLVEAERLLSRAASIRNADGCMPA